LNQNIDSGLMNCMSYGDHLNEIGEFLKYLIVWIWLIRLFTNLATFYISIRQMTRNEEGTELMKTVAGHIRKGALAYLSDCKCLPYLPRRRT